jgi:hypothetical protein
MQQARRPYVNKVAAARVGTDPRGATLSQFA